MPGSESIRSATAPRTPGTRASATRGERRRERAAPPRGALRPAPGLGCSRRARTAARDVGHRARAQGGAGLDAASARARRSHEFTHGDRLLPRRRTTRPRWPPRAAWPVRARAGSSRCRPGCRAPAPSRPRTGRAGSGRRRPGVLARAARRRARAPPRRVSAVTASWSGVPATGPVQACRPTRTRQAVPATGRPARVAGLVRDDPQESTAGTRGQRGTGRAPRSAFTNASCTASSASPGPATSTAVRYAIAWCRRTSDLVRVEITVPGALDQRADRSRSPSSARPSGSVWSCEVHRPGRRGSRGNRSGRRGVPRQTHRPPSDGGPHEIAPERSRTCPSGRARRRSRSPFPAPRLAKGPTDARIDGPGLAEPIALDWDDGRRPTLTALIDATRILGPGRAGRETEPAGDLGPRYVISYSVYDDDGTATPLALHAYPFAAADPLDLRAGRAERVPDGCSARGMAHRDRRADDVVRGAGVSHACRRRRADRLAAAARQPPVAGWLGVALGGSLSGPRPAGRHAGPRADGAALVAAIGLPSSPAPDGARPGDVESVRSGAY